MCRFLWDVGWAGVCVWVCGCEYEIHIFPFESSLLLSLLNTHSKAISGFHVCGSGKGRVCVCVCTHAGLCSDLRTHITHTYKSPSHSPNNDTYSRTCTHTHTHSSSVWQPSSLHRRYRPSSPEAPTPARWGPESSPGLPMEIRVQRQLCLPNKLQICKGGVARVTSF